MRTLELGRPPGVGLTLGQTPDETGDDEAVVFPDGTAIQFIVRQTQRGAVAFPEDAKTTDVFRRYQDALGRFHSAWRTGHTNDPSRGCTGNPESPILGLDSKLGPCTLASAQAAVAFMRQHPDLSPPQFASPTFPTDPQSARDLAMQSGPMTTVLLEMARRAPNQKGKGRPKLSLLRRRGALLAGVAALLGVGTTVLVAKQREAEAFG